MILICILNEDSIHNACVQGDLDRVKYLIHKKGSNIVNEQDNNGYIALHYAARNNHFEICKLLIQNGSNVNTTTFSCKSAPLHRACYMANLDIVKLLLANKADPFLKDIDGKTSLHKCVDETNQIKLNSCIETIKILLSYNQDLMKEVDNQNKTVLDYYPNLTEILNL